MNAPTRLKLGRWGACGVALAVVVLATPLWLPSLGAALTVSDSPEPADAALVLEGTGKEALDAVESWRQQGLVRDVVIVEAPVTTHALVAYWTDFVRWGLAPPAPTPAEHLRVVRAPSTQAARQAAAALPALTELGSQSVLVAGGGGIGSRLVGREVRSVLGPHGIMQRMVPYGESRRDAGRWWQNADDRRAVLDSWLQLLVPFLSGYEAGPGS